MTDREIIEWVGGIEIGKTPRPDDPRFYDRIVEAMVNIGFESLEVGPGVDVARWETRATEYAARWLAENPA